MTDTDTAAATPGGDQTTEQSTESTPSLAAFEQSINDTRHDLGAGVAKALDRLETEYDVGTERELYQALGFPGEKHTIELSIFDAELYLLSQLLDQRTQGQTPAYRFVPLANLQDQLLDETPAESIRTWSEGEPADRFVESLLDDQEADDE